jgi:beta-lactamase class A
MRHHLPLIASFATFVVVSCAGCAAAAAATQVNTGQAAHSPSSTVSASPTAKAAKQAGQRLSAAVASVIKSDDGHAAVAVDDLTTGQTASYNGGGDFVTASIVKVDILSTLLYQSQQSGESLSDEQRELATTMIENSDNDAASDLYDDDGAATGIDAANKAFGLTDTAAGTDGYWGLTTTTVTDQIKVLRQVFTSDSLLTSSSRDYIQNLMSQVEADQRWGVSAAASSGSYLVKNGWLPNPDLWEINSIGEVTHDGQKLLIVVLSADNETEDGGIALVQQIAQATADAITS